MAETKIVAVGAASASFGMMLLSDFAACGDFSGSELVLVDIDEAGLRLMEQAAMRVAAVAGSGVKVRATADVAEALPGAEFVIVSIGVARLEGWKLDWEIPLRRGVKQVSGENAGPGGVFLTLRNAPPILDVAYAMEELCPDALMIVFSNPLPRIVTAVARYSDVRVVGLCHGLEIVRERFAKWLGMAPSEIELVAAGINHFTWVLEVRRRGTGEDLYPRIAELCFGDEPPAEDPLCQALFRRFGLFPTCGDGHTAEFLPAAMVEEFYPFPGELVEEGRVEEIGYPWRFPFEESTQQRAALRRQLGRIAAGEEDVAQLIGAQPREYARDLVRAMVSGEPWVCPAVNVPNVGLIEGLPECGTVEVPAVVEAGGVRPVRVGPLPDGIAAMVAPQLYIQELCAMAAAEGDRDAAVQAIALEPCVGAVELAEAVFEDLFEAERQWLGDAWGQ